MEGNNVFILGAGFSHGCGHPLMKNFIDCGLDRIKDSNDSNAKAAAQRFLDARKTTGMLIKEQNLNNIEEFLTGLSDLQQPREQRIMTDRLMDDVRDFIVATLRYTENREPKILTPLSIAHRKYNNLFDRMTPTGSETKTLVPIPEDDNRVIVSYPEVFLFLVSVDSKDDNPDIIVNFNYDLVIEKVALKERSEVFKVVYPELGEEGVLGDGPITIHMVKPNGSANWINCDTCQKVFALKDYVYAGSPCPKCGGFATRPYIQPPGVKDSVAVLQQKHRLDTIVSKAKHIGVFGYSFPKGDHAYYHQFRRGFLDHIQYPRISIFDPDNNLKTNSPNFAKLDNDLTMRDKVSWSPIDKRKILSLTYQTQEELYKAEYLFGQPVPGLFGLIADVFGKGKVDLLS